MVKGTPKPKIYVSKPLYLDINKLENRFKRADIEFHGVDHSGASYEGRVFLNNPNANRTTIKTAPNGYVGSFYIFGHGGCYGNEGHCEVHNERRPYDRRPSSPLTPAVQASNSDRAITRTGEEYRYLYCYNCSYFSRIDYYEGRRERSKDRKNFYYYI